MSKQTLSIIIPFYNGEEFIGRLIKSINDSILLCEKEDLNFEIIIIIDSPKTRELDIQYLVNSHLSSNKLINLKLVKNKENLGVAKSRNIALDLSTGDFIHIIDQDDEIDKALYPNFVSLRFQNNFILLNGVIKYSNSRFNEHLFYFKSPKLSLKELILDDFIRSPGQVIFSRKVQNGIHFPTTNKHKGADDKFFWILMFLKYQKFINPIYLNAPLYIGYIHESNFSADNQNLQLSALENWDSILEKNNEFGRYQKYVNRNIYYLKYITGNSTNLKSSLMGIYEKMVYSFDVNRVVRYIKKRQ
ncbi:glycosyltransferase family 2 protein [Dyadobacter psychrotolerans]|uniref:Glycosyltransferase family 2 protein n=1 Tax=Dyadobacter psychrotolerans TaxID=2541721 RepID=A0A4R5DIK2_9BACT|nr:glycosyltransferase family 2 protein [Dyadobacter psychrotolerans]TDE13137.1 glycosyltransferase family 2 protein [Dyadobacter psychrotolerans]